MPQETAVHYGGNGQRHLDRRGSLAEWSKNQGSTDQQRGPSEREESARAEHTGFVPLGSRQRSPEVVGRG